MRYYDGCLYEEFHNFYDKVKDMNACQYKKFTDELRENYKPSEDVSDFRGRGKIIKPNRSKHT